MSEPKTLADVTDDDIDRWARLWIESGKPIGPRDTVLTVLDAALRSDRFAVAQELRGDERREYLEVGRKVQDKGNAIDHDRARAAER